MPFQIKPFIADQIEKAASRYVIDLAALNEESRAQSPGGSARSAYDYTYECAVVNRRVAARLRGEDPGPWPFGEGWAQAPAEFRDAETAGAELKSSAEELVSAWNAFPEERIEQPIVLTSGDAKPVELVHLCAVHLNYHDAQLNLLQAMSGDESMHWDD